MAKKAMEQFNKARTEMEKSKKQKRTESVEVVLPNATVGKVVVRFGQCTLGASRCVVRPCWWIECVSLP